MARRVGEKAATHDVGRSMSINGAENVVEKEERGARVDSTSKRNASLLSSRQVDALQVEAS